MKKHHFVRIIFIVLATGSLFFGVALLLSAQLRDFIIITVEEIILHRTLNNREYWYNRLTGYAVPLFILCVLLLSLCIGRTIEKITTVLRGVFLEVRKKQFPRIIILFAYLCLFLFVYVRLNINTMPLIVCWIIWRLGFFTWLIKTFGAKETKTALLISGTAALFFVVVMLLFRCAIVMDVLYGDSNRVFGDFTQIYANHYRVKVHPFYVLIWQSLYHLFSPLAVKTSLAVRTMVAVFAGLNIGIFSLFVSRLTKSRMLNILLCAVMAASFPQIYHGSQMLESFIFTQTSILLMLVYFSFAFSRKEYKLPVLLALALFVTGNNIAYFCIFGIFYLLLLFRTQSSLRVAWNRVWVFSVWFAAIFSVLLLMQTIFYGFTAPSNIFSMLMEIVAEEGRYIATQPVSWKQYAANFFGVMLFEYLPFNIGAVFKHGWIWAALLLLPFVFIKKIAQKYLFFAIAASCTFLFVFHRFYGVNDLPLYAPVIMCMCMSLFAFITQSLPEKTTVVFCVLLLAGELTVNAAGTLTMHRINKSTFGNLDIVDWHECDANIEELNRRVSEYEGSTLFLYKIFEKE